MINLPLIPFIVPPINSYFIIDVENLRHEIQIKRKDLKLRRKNVECLDGTTNGKLIQINIYCDTILHNKRKINQRNTQDINNMKKKQKNTLICKNITSTCIVFTKSLNSSLIGILYCIHFFCTQILNIIQQYK